MVQPRGQWSDITQYLFTKLQEVFVKEYTSSRRSNEIMIMIILEWDSVVDM